MKVFEMLDMFLQPYGIPSDEIQIRSRVVVEGSRI
jgi:hypothetical protein